MAQQPKMIRVRANGVMLWVRSSSVVAVDGISVWIPGIKGCYDDGSCEATDVCNEDELLALLGWTTPSRKAVAHEVVQLNTTQTWIRGQIGVTGPMTELALRAKAPADDICPDDITDALESLLDQGLIEVVSQPGHPAVWWIPL